MSRSKQATKDTDSPIMYVGDSRDLLEFLEPNSIDVVITSPPYFDAKNYDVENQIGYGQTYDTYLHELEQVLSDCYKVTNKTGSLWLIMDTVVRSGNLHLIPFEIAQNLGKQENNWKLTDIVIWDKGKSLPWTKRGEFRKVSEYILFFRKSEDFKFRVDRIREPELTKWWIKWPERYNPLGKIPGDIWSFRIPTQGSWGNGYLRHFCPFPNDLVERILLLTTDENDTVFDPFAGSGAVLATAHRMKRKAVGIELNPEYVTKFFDETLPAFIMEHSDDIQDKLVSPNDTGSKFTKIAALTQLKYVSILLQNIEENTETDDRILKTAFVDVDRDKSKFLKSGQLSPRIALILTEKGYATDLKDMMEKVTSENSLSSFRVETKIIEVILASSFSRTKFGKKILGQGKLSLYSGGKFYQMKETLSDPKTWSEISQLEKKPHFFANIAIEHKNDDVTIGEDSPQQLRL